jgi:hypothetical protein
VWDPGKTFRQSEMPYFEPQTGKGGKAMNQKANPIHKAGERNIWCPYYRGCLDHVVSHQWKTWNCTRCSNQLLKYAQLDLPGAAFYDGLSYHEMAPGVAKVFREGWL